MATVSGDVDDVRIEPEGLDGFIGVPEGAVGLVVFAHGSGSGRMSPRNNHVAGSLRADGLATFLLDLLTPEEEADRRNVFDTALLARRLGRATDWARTHAPTSKLAIGYFGSSTGAAAALIAAAERDDVTAVVSRGGRPDLAGEALRRVTAPTLLLVGGRDTEVIRLNEQARTELRAASELRIVEGASHLFEEPGTLDEVVAHASDWFRAHFPRQRPEG
jgi:pimeloyl-ACP methyl ester carboxylesterase